MAAISYEVEPVDRAVRVLLQSQLSADEVPAGVENADPRVGAAPATPPIAQDQLATDTGAALVHTTASSGLSVAAAAHHDVSGPPGTVTELRILSGDLATTNVRATLRPGQRLRVVKLRCCRQASPRRGRGVGSRSLSRRAEPRGQW